MLILVWHWTVWILKFLPHGEPARFFFNIWMDRMEAVRRGGEFSTLHEMEEELELELGAKAKHFKTPGRKP
jgi:hypothetical protein